MQTVIAISVAVPIGVILLILVVTCIIVCVVVKRRQSQDDGNITVADLGGGSWGSMEPPFGLDLVQRSTGDRLTGTPLSG